MVMLNECNHITVIKLICLQCVRVSSHLVDWTLIKVLHKYIGRKVVKKYCNE